MRLALTIAITVAAVLCQSGLSFAAPANDNFADAQSIGSITEISQSLTGSNVGATAEPGEPNHRHGVPLKSVWYKWTAAADSFVFMSACTPLDEPDPRLDVYQGDTLATLVSVADPASICSAAFHAEAGTSYEIAIDSWTNGSGQTFDEGPFTIDMNAQPNAANDKFANAQLIDPALPQTLSGSDEWAMSEDGEPNHAGMPPARSVWYRLTPSSNDPVRIDVCDSFGPGFELRIAVYTGDTINDLVPVADNGDTRACRLDFVPDSGTEYKIAIDAFAFALPTPFTLKIHNPHPPPNDAFANALAIPATLPAVVDGTTVDATSQIGEPEHYADLEPFYSVWFKWTAPSNGAVSFDTCDSDIPFDSVLAVYRGSAIGYLVQESSDDDGAACTGPGDNNAGSSITTAVTQGIQYHIAVDGYNEGSFRLATSFTSQSVPPGPGTSPAAPHRKRCKKGKKRRKNASTAAKKCKRKRKA
jgi:hypothetical protein